MDCLKNFTYDKWLHRFAVFTAVVAVGLVLAGATVTSTGSGDAVPDWPLSYGTLAPPMIGGILFEHSHRLIAGFTGIFIAVLALWLWRSMRRSQVKWVGLAALFAVLVQATLGGLRVLIVSTEAVQDAALHLTNHANIEAIRIAIAVTHAALAQTIICLLFAICVFTSKSWMQNAPEMTGEKIVRKGRLLSLGLVGIVFLQLVLGALVRHTDAGLIIPDFPLSFGQLIPPFENLPHNPNAPFPLTPSELLLKVSVHFAHRVGALVILAFVTYLFWRYRHSAVLGRMAGLLLGLTLLQATLGALNIYTGKSVYTTVLHVAVGALLLAGSVAFGLWRWRVGSVALPGDQPMPAGVFELPGMDKTKEVSLG